MHTRARRTTSPTRCSTNAHGAPGKFRGRRPWESIPHHYKITQVPWYCRSTKYTKSHNHTYVMTNKNGTEAGSARIIVDLHDGIITVTHGTDNVVLFKKDAYIGAWDDIWSALRLEKGIVYRDDSANVAGTHLVGECETTHANIVRTFGEPDPGMGDSSKTDAEWVLMTPEGVATLYNWKDGKNYLGEDGTELRYIRNWHIGGHSQAVVGHVLEALHIDKPLHVTVK